MKDVRLNPQANRVKYETISIPALPGNLVIYGYANHRIDNQIHLLKFAIGHFRRRWKTSRVSTRVGDVININEGTPGIILVFRVKFRAVCIFGETKTAVVQVGRDIDKFVPGHIRY